MAMHRREFLQVLAAAAAAGLPIASRDAQAANPAAAARMYDIPRFGNVHFLHFTDCHAQQKPIYFREPSVNIGVGEALGQPPHLVGEHLL
jgi:sulfur-oxidizing protein SoxB